MVKLLVNDAELHVQLSHLEHLGALCRDIKLPIRVVASARVSQHPWSELHGMRCPGTGLPYVIMLGTLRYCKGKDFAAVYMRRPAVVVVLKEGAAWGKIILCTADPQADAEAVTEALKQHSK